MTGEVLAERVWRGRAQWLGVRKVRGDPDYVEIAYGSLGEEIRWPGRGVRLHPRTARELSETLWEMLRW